MYSFCRKKPDNPFIAGFAEENLYEGVYKKFTNSECIIYRLEVTEEQYNALEVEISRFLKDKSKYKYNFLGLFGILLNMPLKRSNYYFCSQFVSEVLINSKIFKSSRCPELIRTEDLMAIENKEVVYEGFINQCSEYVEAYNLN
jgi:hypothetical protein